MEVMTSRIDSLQLFGLHHLQQLLFTAGITRFGNVDECRWRAVHAAATRTRQRPITPCRPRQPGVARKHAPELCTTRVQFLGFSQTRKFGTPAFLT